jgi:hypothetical protein
LNKLYLLDFTRINRHVVNPGKDDILKDWRVSNPQEWLSLFLCGDMLRFLLSGLFPITVHNSFSIVSADLPCVSAEAFRVMAGLYDDCYSSHI